MDSDLRKNVFGYYFQYELLTSNLDNICHHPPHPPRYLEEKLTSFELTQQNEKIEWNLHVNRQLTSYYNCGSCVYADYLNFGISKKSNNECLIFYHAILSDKDKKSVLASGTGFITSHANILADIKIDALKAFTCDFGYPYVHLYLADNTVSVKNLLNTTSTVSLKEIGLLKHNYCCSLSDNLSNLFNSELLTDVVVIAKDKEFKVHKAIFGARSSYFAALFKNDLLEKKTSRAYLKDKCGQLINSCIAENFINYMYTGAIENFDQYAIELYELAHMYDMSALQSECISYLKSIMNINNATTILLLAKKYDIKDLRNAISLFFKAHAKEIFDSNNFNAFMALI